MTHSCYDPDAQGRACGRCDSCLLRKKGFQEAGVPDPTPYTRGNVTMLPAAKLALTLWLARRASRRWWTPPRSIPDLVVDLRYATEDNFLKRAGVPGRTRAACC